MAVLNTLRDLGSTRANLFLEFAKSPDPAARDAALACLATTPEKLLTLWPQLNAARRRSSLDALSSTKGGGQALLDAVHNGTLATNELDGSTVERLQAILGPADPGLKSLLERMAGFLRPVLRLDGRDESYLDTHFSLEGAFHRGNVGAA